LAEKTNIRVLPKLCKSRCWCSAARKKAQPTAARQICDHLFAGIDLIPTWLGKERVNLLVEPLRVIEHDEMPVSAMVIWQFLSARTACGVCPEPPRSLYSLYRQSRAQQSVGDLIRAISSRRSWLNRSNMASPRQEDRWPDPVIMRSKSAGLVTIILTAARIRNKLRGSAAMPSASFRHGFDGFHVA